MVITYNEIFTIILCLHALGRKNRASCSITAGQGCIPWEERCLWMAVFGLGSGGAGGGSSQCSNTVSGSQEKQCFVHEEPPTLRRAKQVTSEPRIYVTQLGVLCIPAVFLVDFVYVGALSSFCGCILAGSLDRQLHVV